MCDMSTTESLMQPVLDLHTGLVFCSVPLQRLQRSNSFVRCAYAAGVLRMKALSSHCPDSNHTWQTIGVHVVLQTAPL